MKKNGVIAVLAENGSEGRHVSQSIELQPLTLRAEVRADSIDLEERTVEVIFSTGAEVMRFDWMRGTRYVETLSLDPKHVRLGRLNNSAPLLDSHSAYSIGDVLGVVVPGTARIDKGKAKAQVRFSRREDVEEVWQDVRDGIVRHVSVGYRVYKYQRTPAADDTQVELRHAVDWEPYEISAVPMGADDAATIRSAKTQATNPCLLVTRTTQEERPVMHKCEHCDATAADAQELQRHLAEKHPTEIIVDPADPGAPGAETRSDPPTPAPSDRDAGASAERTRIEGIMRACRAARMPQGFQDKLIREGTSLLDAQDQVLRALEDNDRNGPRVTAVRLETTDPNINVWRGIENALLHRVAPEYFKLEDLGRPYRGLSLVETAKVCLAARGIRTTGMSKMQVIGIALGLEQRAGLHTTSDYALILADVANKTLRRAYEEAPQTFQPFTRRTSIPDFKQVKRTQLGEAPTLAQVNQHGEFTSGTIGEAREVYALATFGRVFGITRQALINDDTDAFSRLALLFGRSARHLESDLVWAQITANGNMGDGVALFHATHANLSGTSDAISVASIGAGRAAMRQQKGVDATQFLNLVPRFLMVPTGKETLADQFVSQALLATQSSNVNPFAGRLTVISDPRLDVASAVSWYLAATTDQIDIIELAGLEGTDGPIVETQVGFKVDGIEVKCRHDVAAKVIDWRGLYKNPGA